MDGKQLSDLIDQRWSTIRELLKISEHQMAAIDAGRMSDLMRLLSGKQKPLNRLAGIAERIRQAAGDDPGIRVWESEQARKQCRQRQDECEQMHLQLLAIEAECETALNLNREAIVQKLDRVDAGRQAASGYGGRERASTRGARLDLSSE